MSKKLNLSQQILMIRKVSVVVYLVLFAAVFFVMDKTGQQARWFYRAKDSLASADTTVFAPASHLVVDVQYRMALAALLGVAAALSVFVLNKGDYKSVKRFTEKFVSLTWINLALVSMFMVWISTMLVGFQDMLTVKVLAGTALISALLAGIVEQQKTKKPWNLYWLSVVTGLLPWVAVASVLLGTALYGSVRLPWFAYAASGVAALNTIFVLGNQFLGLVGYKVWKKADCTERNNVLLPFVSVVAFAAILIVGLWK